MHTVHIFFPQKSHPPSSELIGSNGLSCVAEQSSAELESNNQSNKKMSTFTLRNSCRVRNILYFDWVTLRLKYAFSSNETVENYINFILKVVKRSVSFSNDIHLSCHNAKQENSCRSKWNYCSHNFFTSAVWSKALPSFSYCYLVLSVNFHFDLKICENKISKSQWFQFARSNENVF